MGNSPLYTAVLSICGGILISAFLPQWGIAVTTIGIGSLVYVLSTKSKFDILFNNCGIGKDGVQPILKSQEKTSRGTLYKFTVPAGVSVDDFDRNQKAIEAYLGRNVIIKYTYKEITLEELDMDLKFDYPFVMIPCKGEVKFFVGYDNEEKPVFCDLADGAPHMLVAGETGGGKSTFLRSAIVQLCAKNTRLHLIDLKNGVEFKMFEKCKNVVSFSKTRAEAEKVLKGISLEIDRRYSIFEKAGDCVDIKEYLESGGKMPYEVIIIDEFADMQDDKDSQAILITVGRKARACGIYLIVSTQRPSREVIEGALKCNFGCILGLKVLNDVNSKIVFGRAGLEKLRGDGHAIFRKKAKEIELQCPNIKPQQARELVRQYYVDKPKNEESPADGAVVSFDDFFGSL